MKRHLPVLPPEMRDDTLPGGSFSNAQYGAFKGCGHGYKLKYVDRVETPPEGRMLQGVAVHAGAEFAVKALLSTGAAPSVEEGVAVVEESLKENDGEKVGADKDLSIRLFRLYHARILPTLRPLAVEEYFAVKLGTVTVRGFIDLVDAPQGLPVVVDLKTSAAKWSDADLATDPQFTLYAAVRRTPFVRVDNLVNTKTPAAHQLSSERDARSVAVLTEDYEETVDFIRRGVFPKAPIDSWKCSQKWCSYWASCRGRKL